MDYLQQYVRKEITGLVAAGKQKTERLGSLGRTAQVIVKKDPTPFVKSWSQAHAWKTYNRSAASQRKETTNMQDKHARTLIRASKSDYLRHLLKEEQTLNAQIPSKKSSVSSRNRSQTHTSNSTRRRLCLNSNLSITRLKDLQSLAQFSRQPSGSSQTYLKAKLQHQRSTRPSQLQLKMLSL